MRGGLINWRQEYNPEEIYEMEQDMQRRQEAFDSQMRRQQPQTKEEIIDDIKSYVRMLRRQRRFDELVSIFGNYGVNYQEIDQFLNQGANFMLYDDLADISDALDRVNNPEEDRIPNFLETDMMDADLDEEEEEETKDDVIEERITGRRRQRDEPPDRDTSRQRLDFGSGLRQAMENNVFGHNSIQLGVRPLSL